MIRYDIVCCKVWFSVIYCLLRVWARDISAQTVQTNLLMPTSHRQSHPLHFFDSLLFFATNFYCICNYRRTSFILLKVCF